MFQRTFGKEELSFSTDRADKALSNIEFHLFGELDYTPIAVARALLYKRIPNTTGVGIYTQPFIDSDDLMLEIENRMFYIFPTTDEELNKCRAFADSGFLNDSWLENEPVEKFLKPCFECKCWINEQAKQTIFIAMSTQKKHHHLSLAIFPKLMPWLFKTTPLTSNELVMLNTLTQLNPDEFRSAVDALYDTKLVNQLLFEDDMKALVRRSRLGLVSRAEKDLKDVQQKVENAESMIRGFYLLLREREQAYSAAKMLEGEPENTSTLKAAIQNNPNLENISFDDESTLSLTLRGYLDVFDVDVFESIASNRNGWYYTRYCTDYSVETRQKLLRAIFSDDPLFKIAVRGKISFNLNSLVIKHNTVKDNDVYVNPHLAYYNCSGTAYKTQMYNAEKNCDVLELISLANASLHSINVSESATFGSLLRDFFSSNDIRYADAKMLECTENGKMYTVGEAIEYLKNKEHEE